MLWGYVAMADQDPFCDPETGVCTPADLGQTAKAKVEKDPNREIIYVGDPMCSWCYGISKHLLTLRDHYPQYNFKIVVGGLRPGGGEAWDDRMKDMLKHHWEEVNKRSGQPFGYKLFDRESFNYDTEPSCRAVVAARPYLGERELEFFEAVARHFYLDNEDPTELAFYKPLCEQFQIPFDEFAKAFQSEEVRYETQQEFMLNRQWGVRGYPTVVFSTGKELFQINPGYAEFEQMKEVIEKITAEEAEA